MKTAQILARSMGANSIRQNHKTKMFCITDLVKAFPDKRVADWTKLQSTKEFAEVIMQKEGLEISGVVQTYRGRTAMAGTWVHPLLMVDFAMWVSSEFKYVVLKWVHDNLCEYRDYAGDGFKEMNAACLEVLKFERNWDYINEARMVADVAGVPLGTRNTCGEVALNRLMLVQKMNAKLIRSGVLLQHERRRRLREALELTLPPD